MNKYSTIVLNIMPLILFIAAVALFINEVDSDRAVFNILLFSFFESVTEVGIYIYSTLLIFAAVVVLLFKDEYIERARENKEATKELPGGKVLRFLEECGGYSVPLSCILIGADELAVAVGVSILICWFSIQKYKANNY